VPSTNNFPHETPRQNSRPLFLGPFQPALETALAEQIVAYKKAHGPLAPLTVVVPTRLLALHLQRTMARKLPAASGTGHINVRFATLTDLLPAARIAPRLGLELLCRRLARDVKLFPADGYFAPVRETVGFASALLETFKDLEQAAITPKQFAMAAKTGKLGELAAAYTAYRRWLTEQKFVTESDSFLSVPDAPHSTVFIYGFYDLTVVQRKFVTVLSPAAVFFPWIQHAASSQPLLDWFKSNGFATQRLRATRPVPPLTVLSAPGETSEVREAVREALAFVRKTNGTFNDVAILCRSGEQYDAILRDTLAALGVSAYFRGGRPLTEHADARLLMLLLEAIRSDFNRASVMELACHIGPYAHWDALSVRLGIVGGQAQWRRRLGGANNQELTQFVEKLFGWADSIPRHGRWSEFVGPTLAVFRGLGGKHQGVIDAVSTLVDLDPFESPVGFDTFAELCQRSLEQQAEPAGKFQDGGVFVGDVMAARGLSWPLVFVLGVVEKSFPRIVREDPLLLDAERRQLKVPLKLDGQEEERLLFDLAIGAARERLVLSYPRIEPATAKPRIPSFLLLEAVGAHDFKELEKEETKVPLSPIAERGDALDERELDLAALQQLSEKSTDEYLRAVSPLLPLGVESARSRWRQRKLTRHDGRIVSKQALQLLGERFGLENLTISATSLEDFFTCPFYYFQKHVLVVEPWEEPEAAVSIDALDLGSLYHAILEEYYQRQPSADLAAICEGKFREFEQRGVTGYPTVWQIKKEMVREEVTAFIARDQRESRGWRPSKFEEEFSDVAVVAPIRLRGKIDRIDFSDDGRRARVLDYKTGKRGCDLRNDKLDGGEALQLPLYLIAAEHFLCGVSVDFASYVYLTLRGRYRTISFSREALTRRRQELDGLLGTADQMIRDGIFAQYATTENCRACEFRPICGNGILKLYQLKQSDALMAAFREIKENVK
jgi:ATP-dependent helicase/DNAse subunit B